MVLRSLAADWDVCSEYYRYYLYSIPGHLRVTLISYLGVWRESGVSAADLRILLMPPETREHDSDGDADDADDADDEYSWEYPGQLNNDMTHLDLTGSVGTSIKLRELGEILFPAVEHASGAVQDSWDAPDATSVPRPLIPNLSRLSLAVKPGSRSSVSWKSLLAFSSHLPTLTHLSLAYWPEPSLTPNAKFASVVSPELGRTFQYGGAGAYSHSPDKEWSEALMVLRKLSKNLYGLEYLDLTGCSAWFPALMTREEHDEVDWVADWGKISTLVLCSSYASRDGGEESGAVAGEGADAEALSRSLNNASTAALVERHIRTRRAGRGRIITVERDRAPDSGRASG